MGSRIPIFPLHMLLLPTLDLGIHAFEPRYRELISHSLADGNTFGVVLIKRGHEVVGPVEPCSIGTLAQISGYAKLPDGRFLFEVEGTQRFRIHSFHPSGRYPMAQVSYMSEPIGNFANAKAVSHEVSRLFDIYRESTGNGDLPVRLPVDPVARSYVVASLVQIDVPEKQRLLEIVSAEERLYAEREILLREIGVLDHIKARRSTKR